MSVLQIHGYARGSSSHARGVPVGDRSTTTSQSDPTGTFKTRKELSRSLNQGWRLVKQGLSRTVGQDDNFGLASHGPGSFQTMASSTGQLQVFGNWLSNLQDRVFGSLDSSLQDAVERGYELGARGAKGRVGKPLHEALAGPGTVLDSARQDLEGIAAAVVQQSSRVFSQAVLGRAQPQKVARGLNMIIDKVGVGRTNLLVNYAVVRAHAMGTLDALQALGVQQVGVIPEKLPGNTVHDHMFDAPVELARIKLKFPRPRQKPSKISRARRVERKLEQVFPGLVNVATAGDDLVCPVCERISEEGPYSIDEARSLIPNHPNCRCVFVPYEGPEQ